MGAVAILGLTTEELGMPGKFGGWRPGQEEAIDRILDALLEKRFVAVAAPVGFGKTVVYVAVALAMGWRVCVVTSSKGLQDQLLQDFGAVGMVDIRGRANYDCAIGGLTCEQGLHAKCGLCHQPGHYIADREKACKAPLVVTNYKYWMLSHKLGEGLGKFDLLVLDEAHNSDQEVCGVMRVQFTARQVYRMLESRFPERGDEAGVEVWRAWAKELLPKATRQVMGLQEAAKQSVQLGSTLSGKEAKEVQAWSKLAQDLMTVASMSGPWGVEGIRTSDGSGFALEPIWANKDAAKLLFLDVPHVLLVSATLRPKTLTLLGLTQDEVDFQDYPYVFPIRRSPVYFLPTVQVQWDMSDDARARLESMIDQIISARGDRKGLVHTVSYRLRDQLLEYCAQADVMMTHGRNSEATRAAISRFRGAPPPAVLVSPSIGTGLDFPYRDAEYQIIPKLPFPSIKGSKIMEARCQKRKGGDPEYGSHLMVQELTQTIGRIMRAPDDRGETFILDCHFFWVQKELRRFFVPWVWPLVQKISYPPAPPPALKLAA